MANENSLYASKPKQILQSNKPELMISTINETPPPEVLQLQQENSSELCCQSFPNPIVSTNVINQQFAKLVELNKDANLLGENTSDESYYINERTNANVYKEIEYLIIHFDKVILDKRDILKLDQLLSGNSVGSHMERTELVAFSEDEKRRLMNRIREVTDDFDKFSLGETNTSQIENSNDGDHIEISEQASFSKDGRWRVVNLIKEVADNCEIDVSKNYQVDNRENLQTDFTRVSQDLNVINGADNSTATCSTDNTEIDTISILDETFQVKKYLTIVDNCLQTCVLCPLPSNIEETINVKILKNNILFTVKHSDESLQSGQEKPKDFVFNLDSEYGRELPRNITIENLLDNNRNNNSISDDKLSLPQATMQKLKGIGSKQDCPRHYQCEQCPKSFKLKSSLRKHFRIHTGVKPYACCVCSHKFSDPSNYKRHCRIHRGLSNYNSI